mmetsp:Transcript_349/g.726  ORF Transcript_349/g.726 Transcript_349/m.726 type:complete len:102 (-) Transcript_349:284-589(-)
MQTDTCSSRPPTSTSYNYQCEVQAENKKPVSNEPVSKTMLSALISLSLIRPATSLVEEDVGPCKVLDKARAGGPAHQPHEPSNRAIDARVSVEWAGDDTRR